MRLVALILSLFIVSLSLVPCSDDIHVDEQMELASDHSNHDHEQGDTCNPFCSCSCCGIAGLILSSPVCYSTFQPLEISTISVYNSDFVSSYYYFFWQPPKV